MSYWVYGLIVKIYENTNTKRKTSFFLKIFVGLQTKSIALATTVILHRTALHTRKTENNFFIEGSFFGGFVF